MNKKGTIMDFLYIVVALFIIALSTIIAFTVWDSYNTQVKEDGLGNSSIYPSLEANMNTTMNNMDYLFVFLMVGLTIALIISVFMIKSHPVFFWITMLFIIIVLIIAGALSNAYEMVGDNAELKAGHDNYPAMEFVMDNLPLFILLIAAMAIIALYAKSRYMEVY